MLACKGGSLHPLRFAPPRNLVALPPLRFAQSCGKQQWTANRQTDTSSLEAPRILTFSVAALLCVEKRGGWVFGFF
ncbi:hypothetical protein IQ270_10715 [Microcoleus sp. LEGE 07076]|uniref:hypothetical protein n=1 Tax=Microcoleus sp. LEGE 07076 TaxID=915322 RepID=UPI00187EE34B|nr:hypothetical protein [Microcoleus sp. LEGE 07076]MBE9185174.1 hypothetical protein [Microcoleus sp. LEGE 07076]